MHPDDGRVVSNFILQALRNKDITLYGTGEQTRSFCYVDDLVNALLLLMKSSDTVIGPINIGNPQEFSIRELAEIIVDLTGSSSNITHLPLPVDDPRQRRPDITKATDVLGWKPVTELRSGLIKTIDYFERFLGGPHHKTLRLVS